MAARVEMLKRVRIRRVLAAPDVAAGETYAKLVPRRSERDAFFAAARPGRDLREACDVFTTLGHRGHIGLRFSAVERESRSWDWGQPGLQDDRRRLGRCEKTEQRAGGVRVLDGTGERAREGKPGLELGRNRADEGNAGDV